MSTSPEPSSVENPSSPNAEAEAKPTISKYSTRKGIWTTFDKNGLVTFPRPCRGRVPNFRGAIEAAERLKETEVFKNAKVIKVNADKPQESVRQNVLQEKKRLVMSPRRSETVSLLDVQLPNDLTPAILKTAATRFGVRTYGQPLPIDTDVRIDLLVVGSVAVTRLGQRIGKCDGYSDLEFAFLSDIGIINENTVIATTVHDSQVLDSLPDDLFQTHDFPVDLIVTPTQVIEVTPRATRPPGIIWPILSNRRMSLFPNIVAQRNKCIESGKDCPLKEEDTDDETERDIRQKHRPFYRFRRFRRFSEKKKEDNSQDGEKNEKDEKERKPRPRRPRKNTDKSTGDAKTDAKEKTRNSLPRRRPWRPIPIMFSLRIGGIASTDRVRDLKNALAARNVKPADISWFGPRGFAFLHFAKPRKTVETPADINTVLDMLKDMKLGAAQEENNKSPVVVEPAERKPRKDSSPGVKAKNVEVPVTDSLSKENALPNGQPTEIAAV